MSTTVALRRGRTLRPFGSDAHRHLHRQDRFVLGSPEHVRAQFLVLNLCRILQAGFLAMLQPGGEGIGRVPGCRPG